MIIWPSSIWEWVLVIVVWFTVCLIAGTVEAHHENRKNRESVINNNKKGGDVDSFKTF